MSEQDYEQLTFFQEGFPASHFPWLESKKVKTTTVICGLKCSELSENLRRENVPGILRIAAGDVVADLEREGYDVAVFDFEAAAVGAPHRRERVAFVANRNTKGLQGRDGEKLPECSRERVAWSSGSFVADADYTRSGQGCVLRDTAGARLEERYCKRMGQSKEHAQFESPDCKNVRGWSIYGRTQWAVEPDVGRVAYGVPNRVDRLKCLGNAVVPQQFYPIFAAIAEIIRKENL